jgi:protein TonB
MSEGLLSNGAVEMPEAPSGAAWQRLLLACLFSALLHLVLIGIPVNPTGGVPNVISTIQARLEPAANEDAGAAAAIEANTANDAASPIAENAKSVAEPKRPESRAAEKTSAPPMPSPGAGIEVPVIRDPTYYPARQLDVYPQPVAMIQPKCPEPAVAQRINGRVQLLVLIDEFGLVNEASVTDAQPAGMFDDAAVQAFRAARFVPAQKQGNHVKSRVLLRVNFLCGDTEAPAR